MDTRLLLFLFVGVLGLSACYKGESPKDHTDSSAGDPNTMPPAPLSHTFTTDGWETLDSISGLNAPNRYIRVQDSRFRIRKRIAGTFGGVQEAPACINYGGVQALLVTTMEAKGKAEQTLSYVQGEGDCQ